MIDRQGARIIFECDSCDATLEGDDHEEFKEVWAAAKEEGWRTRKIGGEWVHACPRCDPA